MGILFVVESYDNGLAYGPLTWEEKGLSTGAFSGPYGRGELPEGLYHARRKVLLDKPGQPAFCDSLQRCWFQLLDPQFSTHRTELGIHPDGNKTGTKGCIGILDSDSTAWYEAFHSIGKNKYTVVEVKISTPLPN